MVTFFQLIKGDHFLLAGWLLTLSLGERSALRCVHCLGGGAVEVEESPPGRDKFLSPEFHNRCSTQTYIIREFCGWRGGGVGLALSWVSVNHSEEGRKEFEASTPHPLGPSRHPGFTPLTPELCKGWVVWLSISLEETWFRSCPNLHVLFGGTQFLPILGYVILILI